MATLLVINSSPRANSVSRSLTGRFVDEWKANDPDARVIERDLSAEAVPLINESWIQASYTPAVQRTPEQNRLLALSDQLVDELAAADVIVLGAPMHNFSVPTALRAWIDLVTRAGKTFSYSANGPKGLLPEGKKVVVIGTRGGPYVAASATDFLEPYLRHILGFVGLNDVTFIHADRQGMGGEVAKTAVENAARKLSEVVKECVDRCPAAA